MRCMSAESQICCFRVQTALKQTNLFLIHFQWHHFKRFTPIWGIGLNGKFLTWRAVNQLHIVWFMFVGGCELCTQTNSEFKNCCRWLLWPPSDVGSIDEFAALKMSLLPWRRVCCPPPMSDLLTSLLPRRRVCCPGDEFAAPPPSDVGPIDEFAALKTSLLPWRRVCCRDMSWTYFPWMPCVDVPRLPWRAPDMSCCAAADVLLMSWCATADVPPQDALKVK